MLPRCHQVSTLRKMAAAWSPVGRYRSCSADSGFSDVDLPPLLGMKQMDLLAHPRNYKSFQERFPEPGAGAPASVALTPMFLTGHRPRRAPADAAEAPSAASWLFGAPAAAPAPPAAVYVRAWCRSSEADAYPYADPYAEAGDGDSARRVGRTAPRAPSRAGTCAFDGARLLLDAAGGGARVVVTLHEGGEGGDERDNVVGRAVLPAVPAGCLVDKFPLLDAAGAPTRAGKGCEIPNFKGSYLGRFSLVLADFWTSDHLSERSRSVHAFFRNARARNTHVEATLNLSVPAQAPTGACLTCAVKRVAGYLPPPLYQHALYVYEQRPAPYLGPLLHMNEPWAPLGVSLEAAPAPGAVLGPDVALPEAWARGDGPGGILVADWTLCNTPWAGDDHGWTYSDALGSAAASRVDFYGACFRRQLYYRHATDDARVLEVTRGDLPPYDLYDHVVRVHHRLESSDLGSRAGPDDDAGLLLRATRASAALTDEVYCRLLLVAANRRRPNRKRKAWELLAAVSRRRAPRDVVLCRVARAAAAAAAAVAQDQDDAATAAVATYVADAMDVVLRG